MKIEDMQTRAYDMAVAKGWWPAPPVVQDGRIANYERISSALALIHAEVSEALEELRDSTCIDAVRYDPARGNKPEGFGVELADIVLRVADLAGATAAGDALRWTPSCTTACARCHRHNVDQLMHVVAVLDDVVPGGVQYFTKIKDMRRLCDECGGAEGEALVDRWYFGVDPSTTPDESMTVTLTSGGEVTITPSGGDSLRGPRPFAQEIHGEWVPDPAIDGYPGDPQLDKQRPLNTSHASMDSACRITLHHDPKDTTP